MLCVIWYHLYNSKTWKTPIGVLLLVKFLASAWNFTKSNIPPWMFFVFFKLYKCTKSPKTSHINYVNKNNCDFAKEARKFVLMRLKLQKIPRIYQKLERLQQNKFCRVHFNKSSGLYLNCNKPKLYIEATCYKL